MEKIYISGQISGQPIEEVAAKFEAAETMLKAQGYEVVNPLKNGIPANASWEVHVAMDVLLLMGCKAIYLLPDWGFSKGATLEKNLAELTGKTIIYEEVPTFQNIKQAIAEGMGVAFYDIVGESREQKHVFARMIFANADHRVLLPGSIVVGMDMMLVCDILAKNLVLPVNSITALMGIPVILWVIFRNLRIV